MRMGEVAYRWIAIIFFIVLGVSITCPTIAHTTLGNLNDNPPLFRSDDHQSSPTNRFGGHVPGPLGYVWPGSGLNMYSGNPMYPPGYQSPFTTYEKPLQVSGNAYAPEGAILTSTTDHETVGDLIFALNFSQPKAFISESAAPTSFSYGSLAIYIPAPVFDETGTLIQDGFEPAGGIDWENGENTNIITTITDNYGSIFVSRADENDPFGPGSWLIYIIASEQGIDFTAGRSWSEWYYIRINQMKAPYVAGRYFFKLFLNDSFPLHRQEAESLISSTMPMENWPTLQVKGEVDPGIIYGTVKHGNIGSNDLYGLPLHLSGRVRAVGVAIDPVTSEVTDRRVEARGYFNASAGGHFEVEGVAPGIYDIYVSAAGYPEQKAAEGVKIRRGQSFMLDPYLKVGPVIRGVVNSKDSYGITEWPGQRPVQVVIYDSDAYRSEDIVASSPVNLTHAPYTSYVIGDTIFSGDSLASPSVPRPVAFPWEGLVGYYAYTISPDYKDPYGLFNGVGPSQRWWVDPSSSLDPISNLGSSSSDFTFQFGQNGVYGIPTELSGMVPQIFAGWTSSLNPGVYYLRVYVNGYVQTSGDGIKFIHYPVFIPDVDFPRNFFIPIDLFRSAAINVTVRFHNLPDTITDDAVKGPDPTRFIIAEAFASDGALAAFNFTQVASTGRNKSILLNGLGMAGCLAPPDPRASIKYSLGQYRGLYDYGLPSDTYTIRVFMRGYIQATPPAHTILHLDQPLTVSISIGDGTSSVSTHMYRGCGINTTVYAVDWERPTINRNWIWENAPVSILVYDVASSDFVDVIYYWSSDLYQWAIPTQNSDHATLPWPGWKTFFGSDSSYLVTNGSTLVDRFGPDMPSFSTAHPTQDMATPLFLQESFHAGFLYSTTSYRYPDFRSALAIYPGIYA
ncbi:carboxypeptidase-like regulatory domain-containing protein, partial [[Eubacterium] cellulosolvens]